MNEPKKFFELTSTEPFNHNWLPKQKIQQINRPEGRRYLIDNKYLYPSVTTVLGTLSNKEIEEWKKAVGTIEADRVSKRATGLGTILHDRVERFLLNEVVQIPKTDFISVNNFKRLVPVLSRINNIKLLEFPLYSHILKMAGTIDCCAEYEGELSVIDFKTSSRLKDKSEIDSYFIQTGIYSLMIEELYKIKINRLVIIMSINNETPKVFIDSRSNWLNEIANLMPIAKSLTTCLE